MDPSPDSSYVRLFSQPLIAFPAGLTSQSSGVADLPILWSSCLQDHSVLPIRFSDNKDLMKRLANNFRAFAAQMPVPPDPEVCKAYQACTGPWTSEQRVMYLPDQKTCGESQISSLHLQILMPLLSNLFRQFVQNHPACTTLKDNNVFLSFNRNTGQQQCGVVDHVFYIETPNRDPPIEPSLWFDHKNPTVLSTHQSDIDGLVTAGHRLNWDKSSPIPAKTLLRKVRSLTHTNASIDTPLTRVHTTAPPEVSHLGCIHHGSTSSS